MGIDQVVVLAGQFGPMGLLVAYLIWRESGERKDRRELKEADIAAREKLAVSLNTLSMVIQGKPHV